MNKYKQPPGKRQTHKQKMPTQQTLPLVIVSPITSKPSSVNKSQISSKCKNNLPKLDERQSVSESNIVYSKVTHNRMMNVSVANQPDECELKLPEVAETQRTNRNSEIIHDSWATESSKER